MVGHHSGKLGLSGWRSGEHLHWWTGTETHVTLTLTTVRGNPYPSTKTVTVETASSWCKDNGQCKHMWVTYLTQTAFIRVGDYINLVCMCVCVSWVSSGDACTSPCWFLGDIWSHLSLSSKSARFSHSFWVWCLVSIFGFRLISVWKAYSANNVHSECVRYSCHAGYLHFDRVLYQSLRCISRHCHSHCPWLWRQH